MKDSLKLKRAERSTDRLPSQEQIIDGTYKKGRVNLKGFDIAIENPVNSVRSGVDEQGNPWSNTMTYSYGYFENTMGKDGDPVDVFIGPEIDNNFDIYVIDQVREDTREFDEHKVMFGFGSEGEAVKAYLDNYQSGWTGFQDVSTITLASFNKWLNDDELTKLPIKMKKDNRMNYLNSSGDPEKINIIKLIGEVVVGETLKNLQMQAGDIQPGETLVLEIASPGGSVAEGIEIMLWLEQLSLKGVTVITLVIANAYSIASLIMLAANIRLISKHGQVMVHNPMVPELSYVNANELEKHINSLRDLEGYMYQLYQTFTGLNEEGIKLLMDNETYLSPSEAIKNGFADMVVNTKKTPYEMASKQEKTVNMSKTVNMLKHLIAKVKNDEFVAQLYYDQEGGAIEVYQADPSQYQIGDKVDIADGEKVFADGSKLIIEEGMIKEIIPAEVVQPADQGELVVEPELDTVDQDNPSTEPVIEPTTIDAIVDEPGQVAGDFNTGPAPVVPETKAKDAMPAEVIEKVETVSTTQTIAQAEPGKEPVAKVEPVAQVVEPAAQAPAIEPVEPAAPISQEVISLEEFRALQNQVHEMKSVMEGYKSQLDDYKSKEEMKAKENEDFRSTAVEAIETLANSTVSGFKPEARASVVPATPRVGSNSIFQTLRRKANLAK